MNVNAEVNCWSGNWEVRGEGIQQKHVETSAEQWTEGRRGDGMNNEGERERRRGKEEPTNYKDVNRGAYGMRQGRQWKQASDLNSKSPKTFCLSQKYKIST